MEVGAFWVTQMTILSAILIFLVHSLIQYFQTTLTVPKMHAKPQHIYIPAMPLQQQLHQQLEEKEDDLEAMRNELMSYIG
jgi:hypothetical protein